MPYYRILIQLRSPGRPVAGIRWDDEPNITVMQVKMAGKARAHYGNELKDVEVQMLAKTCTAVKDHIRKLASQKETRSWMPNSKPGNGYDPTRDLRKNAAGQGNL